MENLRRPKTANPNSLQQQQKQHECFATDLAARTTLQQPFHQRPKSQRSTADWETSSRQGLRHNYQCPPPQQMLARSVEIQTDPPNVNYGEYQDAYETIGIAGGGGRELPEEPIIDEAQWQLYQLPGYHSLPVMQPMKVMNPYGRSVNANPSVPASALPFHRAGRNGSNWRHVTQCSGYLGNHIVFIDGHVKSNDCRRFPPHGYPAGCSGPGAQAVPLPIPSPTANVPPGYRHSAGLQSMGSRTGSRPVTSKALQRARVGNKYWFEDRQPSTLTPNTIQGRIMKSGSAY